jgi:hypothetical protein
LKKEKSDDRHVTFLQQRQALDIRIEKHQEQAATDLPTNGWDEIHHPGDDVDDGWIDNEWKDIADYGMEIPDTPFSFSFPLIGVFTELSQEGDKKAVCLLSTLGHEQCAKLGLQVLIVKGKQTIPWK